MNALDRRRKRQIFLFLAAILIPTIVLITLAVRLARQESELASERTAHERRDALDQLRRELTARLEAIKLQQLNGLPNEPVVFTATLVQNRLILPWQTRPRATPSPARFAQYQREGEAREFLGNDYLGALDAYKEARVAAHGGSDQCSAMLAQGRVLVKAQIDAEAADIYRSMLGGCDSFEDDDGMTFALYAAERLTSMHLDIAAAGEYVAKRARLPQWLPPVQMFLMRSLLADAAGVEAKQSQEALTAKIHDSMQIMDLGNDLNRLGRLDFPFHASPGRSVWLAYGDEPWLLTVMSTGSFEPPVVLAVSSKKISPPGLKLTASSSDSSVPVGEGFVDLEVEWNPGRFAPATTVPPFLYFAGVGLILSITLLVAYFLLRDVSREIEVAEMRSHFVASVSHELKTPLTAIRMFAETLAMGRGEDQQTRSEYLETIVNESERLSRLVDNVLDFSRIESGKKIYRMQRVSLPDIVRAAAQAMQYPLTQHGFSMNISIDDAVPLVEADADALQQAILNLLANAMKYSGDAREIDLSLTRLDGEAVIKVMDRGIGIAAEDQQKIFEKFYRVRSDQSDRVPGTGLGLTLATHIVKAHAGRLQVSSEVGRGSTFSICLPLQSAETKP